MIDLRGTPSTARGRPNVRNGRLGLQSHRPLEVQRAGTRCHVQTHLVKVGPSAMLPAPYDIPRASGYVIAATFGRSR
jgi:hypothetical protein